MALSRGEPGPRTLVHDLAIIVAVAANGVIGDGLQLPWRIPDDLKRFRRLTTGHAVIMGRRTWQSLPRALPGRQNIVVSRNPRFAATGAEVANSLADAMARVHLPAPAFVIGGRSLVADALADASVFHLTEVHADYPGDVLLPPLDRSHWREVEREEIAVSDGVPAHAFVTLQRQAAIAEVAGRVTDLR